MQILEIIFKLWKNSCNSILMSRLQYQLNAPAISTDRNFLEEYQNLGITYLTGVVSVSGLFHFDPAWQVWNARCHFSRYKRQSTMSHQHLTASQHQLHSLENSRTTTGEQTFHFILRVTYELPLLYLTFKCNSQFSY